MTFPVFTVFACALALVANGLCIILRMDYLSSVLVSMGAVSAALVVSARSAPWSRASIRTALIFILGSAVITTGIEKLMLVLDVWGFSRRYYHLIGIDFLGCPIEEYVYWWLAPVVVAVTYVTCPRSYKAIDISAPAWLLSFASVLGTSMTRLNQSRPASGSGYLEDSKVDVEDKSYSRGSKFPVWAAVAAAVVLGCFFVYRHFRGSRNAIIATTLVFVCVAYPNELYSLSHGFWSYNQSRILDIWFLGVPVEEWFMYICSPICGGMLFSVLEEKLFGQVI